MRMAYSVTVYNVMNGSPSDVQERRLVEYILAKWNHKQGEEKRLVFLPAAEDTKSTDLRTKRYACYPVLDEAGIADR